MESISALSDTCIIDNNEEKFITFRKYVSGETISKEGTKKTTSQKMLIQALANYKTLFEEFHKFLKTKCLPHRWNSIWDGFHRNLSFDYLQRDTLIFGCT